MSAQNHTAALDPARIPPPAGRGIWSRLRARLSSSDTPQEPAASPFPADAHIAPSARIEGIAGIHIGPGSQIHPHAVLAANHLPPAGHSGMPPEGSIRLGRNNVIGQGAIIATYGGDIEIGDDVSINPYCILYGHGGLKIGRDTRIAARCSIIPANHLTDPALPIREQGLSLQGIEIGEDCWIGAGATILDGTTIGDQSIIAAGAVVTRSCPPRTILAGVPAKPIGTRGETP